MLEIYAPGWMMSRMLISAIRDHVAAGEDVESGFIGQSGFTRKKCRSCILSGRVYAFR